MVFYELVDVLYLILVSNIFGLSVSQLYFESFHLHSGFQDQYCTNEITTITERPTVVSCGIKCLLTSKCIGIFYNENTKVCSTVITVSVPEIGCENQTGSNFYLLMSYDAFEPYTNTPADEVRLSTETAEEICNSYSNNIVNTDLDASKTACGSSLCCKTKGCFTGVLQEYKGKWSKTEPGRTCQRWDQQSPHKHTRDTTGTWIGETPTEAENYCRDPDYEDVRPITPPEDREKKAKPTKPPERKVIVTGDTDLLLKHLFADVLGEEKKGPNSNVAHLKRGRPPKKINAVGKSNVKGLLSGEDPYLIDNSVTQKLFPQLSLESSARQGHSGKDPVE